jgi:hypothetical protein
MGTLTYGLPTSSGKRWAVEREYAFCQLVAKEKYRGVVYQYSFFLQMKKGAFHQRGVVRGDIVDRRVLLWLMIRATLGSRARVRLLPVGGEGEVSRRGLPGAGDGAGKLWRWGVRKTRSGVLLFPSDEERRFPPARRCPWRYSGDGVIADYDDPEIEKLLADVNVPIVGVGGSYHQPPLFDVFDSRPKILFNKDIPLQLGGLQILADTLKGYDRG